MKVHTRGGARRASSASLTDCEASVSLPSAAGNDIAPGRVVASDSEMDDALGFAITTDNIVGVFAISRAAIRHATGNGRGRSLARVSLVTLHQHERASLGA